MRRSRVRFALCLFTVGMLSLSYSLFATEMEDLRIDFDGSSRLPGSMAQLAMTPEGLVLTSLLAPDVEGVYDSGPIASPFPFTAVGPHWVVDTPEGTDFRLELSTSPDGLEWSEFNEVHVDPHLEPTEFMPDGRPNPNFGHTMGGLRFRSRGDGAYVRYRAILSRAAGVTETPVLQHLTLTFIDSRLPSGDSELNFDDPGLTTQSEAGSYPKPPVNSRGAWGALPPNCTYSYCTVTHIATHHTAGVGEYSCSGFNDCAADVRAIQSFHMFTNGWCDLGYNYLVSSDGQIWEGRGGGDDVRGAHDGFNCGSMGVSNMGYYHTPWNHVWTEAQLDAEAELNAWKADQKNIDPFGVDFYAGFGGNMDNLYGHQDVAATACPGDNIYSRLGELRNRVSDKLNGGGGGNEFIYDNPSVSILRGDWITGTSAPDKWGANYYWTSTATADTRLCVWDINLAESGTYDVSFWWPDGANRTPAAEVGVKQTTLQLATVNQQINGGQWNSIGSFFFNAGAVKAGIRNGGPAGWVVMCDAVRFTKQ